MHTLESSLYNFGFLNGMLAKKRKPLDFSGGFRFLQTANCKLQTI
jgi:hypothetical protein